MNIALLSSYPPVACGVGDYTAQLEQHLMSLDVKVKVFTHENWAISHVKNIWTQIMAFEPDVIHIQYPTVSFGSSLAPQIIAAAAWCRRIPVVVTIHEFSQAHILRKLAILPFGLFSKAFIFTTQFELECYRKWSPITPRQTAIIPIGSSIPFLPEGEVKRDKDSAVYFGLIRPNKGLEDFIELARLSAQQQKQFKFHIIGSPQVQSQDYYENLRRDTVSLSNIQWHTGLTPDAIADILTQSEYTYLPFPDGASERRSSLLAALGNGTVVLTTMGDQTPSHFKDMVVFVNNPQQAMNQLGALRNDLDKCRQIRSTIYDMMKRYSWDGIAQSHMAVYEAYIRR